MRRASIGVAVLLGTLAVSARPSTEARRQTAALVERINGRDAVAGEVLLKLQPASDLAQIEALTDAESLKGIGRGRAYRLRSKSLDTKRLLGLLGKHPSVRYAEPNYIVHAFTEPPDPLVPQLWGIRNVGQAVNGGLPGHAGADIHAEQAWDVSFGSTVHVVAVIDTGIDYTHRDLASNMWSAPAPFTVNIAGVSITCRPARTGSTPLR